MEPEEFTKEIGGRTIRGMIYSFRNDDGKTITAIQYLEPVGDSWYQYFCDYISESDDEDALPDETTVAEFEHAIETLTFEEN